MDVRYQAFCVADPTFYDAPRRAPAAADAFIAGRVLPPRWRVLDKDDWTVLAPPAVDLAAQGWKIHVSATPSNARDVLDRVWRYCVAQAICFKFLRDPLTLFIRNAKYADRSASGKFVTVYPPTVECLEAALGELGAALGRQPGPYILSDARWGDGPLFVRYGGFLERRMRTADGAVVAAIESPDGRLVPDRRQPIFEVPEWVAVPAFLAPHVAMRRADGWPADFPYRIERPLHFSNGGGVYLAVDTRTERRVVLREARPFAG
ncbi:MAG TPA: hypothetical protein VNG89_04010, partial [Vicinamibacterales bacterium]|nr:hypothetical protein [Vicinamibacterales bacterium]